MGQSGNLGWKVAATIHYKAHKGVLDANSAERHPVGAAVLDWSTAQAGILSPGLHARYETKGDFDLANEAASRWFSDPVVQKSLRLPDCPVRVPKHPSKEGRNHYRSAGIFW